MTKKQYFVNVLLAYNLSKEFTYKIDKYVEIGSIVRVPFRSKKYIGIVTEHLKKPNFQKSKIKEVDSVSNKFLFKSRHLKFLDWVAKYNLIDRGNILKMMLPNSDIFFKELKKKYEINDEMNIRLINLNNEQLKASNYISTKMKEKKYQTVVIDGVPGSGKTEVYFRVIEENLRLNTQVLILFPEVSLTSEFVKRVKNHFGLDPDVWHSKISPSQKKISLDRIINGKAKIIVGARSALFLPFKKLGLMIIDEEHDGSYKQEEKGIYQARDMAVVRASIEKIPLLLVSATPSLETSYNILKKKYDKVSLTHKYQQIPFPRVEIVDMKKEKLKKDEWISKTLRVQIEKNIIEKKQVLLFINKRGYAPVIICKACGHKITCKNCSSYLVEHLHSKNLLCHHCGFKLNSFKLECSECKNVDANFIDYGVGIEKVFTEVSRLFPTARTCMFSSDHVKSGGDITKKVNQILNHEYDIIIGTQLITKGYHFPLLTCVGIIDADMTLRGGDMRAAEKTYQLLYQVAGRAGREDANGIVYIQSYYPKNETILSLKEMDRNKFYKNELNYRKISQLPPVGKMAAIILSGHKKNEVDQSCLQLLKCAPNISDIEIYGPAPAPLSRLKGNFRQRFLIHDKKSRNIQKFITNWIVKYPQNSKVNITVDIDPYNFI